MTGTERAALRLALPSEEWRAVPGWGGRYAVSSLGRVFSLGDAHHSPRMLSASKPSKTRRASVGLWAAGEKPRRVSVHRLVALAFLGPPPSDAHEVAHGDGDPGNNAAANLRWATPSENQRDSVRHGTARFLRPVRHVTGTAHHASKLTPDIVREIRARLEAGASHRAIAATFGISRGTTADIAARHTWKEVT